MIRESKKKNIYIFYHLFIIYKNKGRDGSDKKRGRRSKKLLDDLKDM
jgi:hypothetical protein